MNNVATHHKDNPPGRRICHFYNKFDVAYCELPNNQYSWGYIHKCSVCFKVSCKAHIHQKASSPPFLPQGNHPPPCNSSHSHRVHTNYVAPKGNNFSDTLIDSVQSVVHDSFQSLKQDLTTSIEKEVKRQLPQFSPASLSNATTLQVQLLACLLPLLCP